MARLRDPRTVFRQDRVKARGGEVVYDGDRFPIAFPRQIQDRIDALAVEWEVPRSAMIRWLVAYAFERLDHRGAAPIRRQ
jgi:hypothetical protein